MKVALLFISGLLSGLVLGGAAVFYFKSHQARPAADVVEADGRAQAIGRQLEEARQTVERTRAEAATLRQELNAARLDLRAARPAPTEPPPAPPTETVAKEDEGSKKFGEMIKAIGQTQVKGQMEGKLAQLKDRLKLTPDQQATLKNLVGQSTDGMLQALMRMLEGKGEPGDFGRLVRLQLGQLPEEVETVLTDEQKTEYAKFKLEERSNRIEMRANAELLALQAAGGLTPEQKDEAFTKLTELATVEEEVDWNNIKTADQVRSFFDQAFAQRIERMRPILTESQMAGYQTQVEMQKETITRFVPALAPPKGQ